MDADFVISMLGALSPESVESISSFKVESQCVFTQEPDCEDEDEFVQAQKSYVFQVRDNFLVDYEPSQKKIIGGVRLDLDYKFEIKRFTYDPESPLGKPFAFVLYFPTQEDDDQQLAIKLGVGLQAADSLEYFGQILAEKQIYQLELHNNFKVVERLFCSNSAALYAAHRLRDNQLIAIKCIRKDLFKQFNRDLKKKGIEREYCIPRKFDSPYICKYFGLFDSDTSVYIIMEKLELNLLQYLQMKLFRSQDDLTEIFYKICIVVHQLHQNGVMHRDIKPENIMLRKLQSGRYQPVLIDFGLAEYDGVLPYIFVKCGTPGYLAPEINHSDTKIPTYDRKCDIFSLGCLFHFILLRKPLFDGSSFQQVIQKNKAYAIDLETGQYELLQKSAKNLLNSMLKINPVERISAAEILQHEYFQICRPAQKVESKQSQGQIVEGPCRQLTDS